MAEVKFKNTFFSKKIITCPICNCEFNKEEIQTGRGRINAGELTEELRRLYIPTKKYGLINPLFYSILVCPECYFAGLANDFKKAKELREPIRNEIFNEAPLRKEIIQKIFGQVIDYKEFRDIFSGLASYILAFSSVGFLGKNHAPSAHRGLYSLRGAWLAGDIYEMHKIPLFKQLSNDLYNQAFINYSQALERQSTRQEILDGFVWMGPDGDINYGYDGLLYIIAYLTMKHIEQFKGDEKIIKIGQVKRVLSIIFGFGKSSREKPAVLVSLARKIYERCNTELKILEEMGLDTEVADKIEQEAFENEDQ